MMTMKETVNMYLYQAKNKSIYQDLEAKKLKKKRKKGKKKVYNYKMYKL